MKKNIRAGRPMKYDIYLIILDDEAVYSPGAIAHQARDAGLMKDLTGQDLKDAIRRARHSLNRFRVNHYFPEEGDGKVKIGNQSPAIGWTGKRWKDAVKAKALPREVREITKRPSAYLRGLFERNRLDDETAKDFALRVEVCLQTASNRQGGSVE